MKKCPFLKKTCIGEDCQLWQQRVSDTADVKKDCAINWVTDLLAENARFTYSVGGAVESLREESVKGTNNVAKMIAMTIQQTDPRLLE